MNLQKILKAETDPSSEKLVFCQKRCEKLTRKDISNASLSGWNSNPDPNRSGVHHIHVVRVIYIKKKTRFRRNKLAICILNERARTYFYNFDVFHNISPSAIVERKHFCVADVSPHLTREEAVFPNISISSIRSGWDCDIALGSMINWLDHSNASYRIIVGRWRHSLSELVFKFLKISINLKITTLKPRR